MTNIMAPAPATVTAHSRSKPPQKLRGILGLRVAGKGNVAADSSHRKPVPIYDDPVKEMQDRMLHKALHNRTGAAYQPPLHSMVRSQPKAPRGTLNEEKLPYLDWRLSLLLLQQVQNDEKELMKEEQERERAFNLISHADDIVVTHVEDRSCGLDLRAAPISQQESGTSSGYASDSPPGQDYLTSMVRHEHLPQQDTWLSSKSQPLSTMIEAYSEDQYSKNTVHLLTSEALAVVPLLDRESRYLAAAESGDDVEDDQGSGEDQFFEFEESTEPVPAPLMPASLFHRASFGIRSSTSLERSNSSTSNSGKIARLFNRPLTSRSHSHGYLDRKEQYNTGVSNHSNHKNSEQEGSKSRRKWSLLSLHNLGGSEFARGADAII